jgi:HEAT repeat protein
LRWLPGSPAEAENAPDVVPSLYAKSEDGIPTLAPLLKTEKAPSPLAAAAYALGNMGWQLGAEGKVGVAPLIKVLKRRDSQVRRRAANALDGQDRAALRGSPALVAEWVECPACGEESARVAGLNGGDAEACPSCGSR